MCSRKESRDGMHSEREYRVVHHLRCRTISRGLDQHCDNVLELRSGSLRIFRISDEQPVFGSLRRRAIWVRGKHII